MYIYIYTYIMNHEACWINPKPPNTSPFQAQQTKAHEKGCTNSSNGKNATLCYGLYWRKMKQLSLVSTALFWCDPYAPTQCRHLCTIWTPLDLGSRNCSAEEQEPLGCSEHRRFVAFFLGSTQDPPGMTVTLLLQMTHSWNNIFSPLNLFFPRPDVDTFTRR